MSKSYFLDKFPIPVWEWSRQLGAIFYKQPHRAEDFARSFSKNQFVAKTWALEVLQTIDAPELDDNPVFTIAGSWYGTIFVPLMKYIWGYNTRINLVDFDEGALRVAGELHGMHFIKHFHMDLNWDMHRLKKIKTDILINTSMEHMYPWTDISFGGKLCVFQSNNFITDHAHINCSETLEDFVEQMNMDEVLYQGEIPFHDYDDEHKRFMVIGRK
jgi:hypothetical protein